MGEAGGEDERRAFDGKDDGGLEEAGDESGVSGAERRRNGCGDGGKADDDDGLGIVEGRGELRRRLMASWSGKEMAGMYWN